MTLSLTYTDLSEDGKTELPYTFEIVINGYEVTVRNIRPEPCDAVKHEIELIRSYYERQHEPNAYECWLGSLEVN